jgi:hypothetical protein
MENQTKEQAIEMVQNSFPTIFSKEDVIALINSIKVNEVIVKGTIINEASAIDMRNEKLMEAFKNYITNEIDSISIEDVVDTDNISLSLDYDRQIQVEVEGINHDSILETVKSSIDDFFNSFDEGDRSMNEYI